MLKPFKQEIDFQGKNFSIETGKYAKQADGAIWLKYGNTVILATVVGSKEEITEETDFFPLTVDYIEKFYAAGRFPGGFMKRESQPSTEEKLTSRLIDRPIRPLFPSWFKNETQIMATLLSYDVECDPKVASVTAASAALMISDIPFEGPVGAVRIIEKNGGYIINPTKEQEEGAKLNIVMAAKRDAIVMVEGEANEASEAEISAALKAGHEAILPLLDVQEKLMADVAPEKRTAPQIVKDEEIISFVKEFVREPLKGTITISEKLKRYSAIKEIKDALDVKIAEKYAAGEEFITGSVEKATRKAHFLFEDELKYVMRSMIVDEHKRIDGRNPEQIRPIWIETGVLPNVHGSAIFTRGETQSLGTLTLGIATDEQRVDIVTDNYSKSFMLHYNFPAFSVGEIGRLKSPGRREIGHGNLAERALKAIVPSQEEFAYTIRLVSEILESNGSSSQATVCSGCLALMDGGVPVKKHVAGIAMGLIYENNKYLILSDIMGDEDHLGDMDFKVAGTVDGITAIQMDIKIDGLPQDVMEKALKQAYEGRLHIIGEMKKAMPEARKELSDVAPKIEHIKISKDKIRDLIGKGGETIKGIIAATGADLNVDDDGNVTIAASSSVVLEKTIALVKAYTEVVEPGKIYTGKVTRIEEYGAFVEVLPGQTGLLHISKMAEGHVDKVSDVLKLDDVIKVIVTDIDFQGKFKLSMKESDFTADYSAPRPKSERPERRDRGERRERR